MVELSRRAALLGAAAALGAASAHAAAPQTFLRAVGRTIRTPEGAPVTLHGVSFGNWVWANDRLPVTHHGEEDYARVRGMGMNLVRFYLNYRTLESDDAPGVYLPDGWDWIDRNIAWAKAHGVGLFLNLHVPPGGFQSLGEGRALWENPANQTRTVNLWRAIAARYADETAILGYDLVNEPGVTSSVEQWRDLAQRIATAVREVDQRHPLIVERVNSINRQWINNADMNFVKIEDPNVIYTFHFYDPFEFSHQGAEWIDIMHSVDRVYPDPARGFTKAGLAASMSPYLQWAERNNAPLYLGEWGLIRQCYEGGRGGLVWASDMLDVMNAAGIVAQTYHTYHEDPFGIYRGHGVIDPRNANQGLIDLFARRLAREALLR